MSPLEDIRAAETEQHQLEDNLHTTIQALIRARGFHKDLDHSQASIWTEIAQKNLEAIVAAEIRLIDYQGRAETYPQNVWTD